MLKKITIALILAILLVNIGLYFFNSSEVQVDPAIIENTTFIIENDESEYVLNQMQNSSGEVLEITSIEDDLKKEELKKANERFENLTQ